MSDFYAAVQKTLANEAGNDPNGGWIEDDEGRGPNRWGVTLQSYQEFFPQATRDTIFHLTRQQAIDFYLAAFWNRYHIGKLVDQALAEKIFDIGVNEGGGTAIRLMQQGLGLPSDQCDGVIGPVTAQAANMDPAKTLMLFQQNAAAYYRSLKKPPSEIQAWLRRLYT